MSVEMNLGGALTPRLGVCPGQNTAGDPGMDPGNPRSVSSDTETTFGLDLNKGDTLLVEARRSDTAPNGFAFGSITQLPGIRFRVFIDGALLQADEVAGNLISDTGDDSPSVSFSFTAQ